MTPDRYQKLSLLFNQTMEHPPEERESFARQLCNLDGDLLPELLKLVRAVADPPTHLTLP